MNKQLVKLLSDAGFHQPEIERQALELKFEKFVELIVRECAESCTLQQDVNDMYFRLGVKR